MSGPRWMWLTPILIVLAAGSPVIFVLLASWTAGALGCRLNEADAHPCLVAGIDIGGLLYSMFVLGWLGFLTLPLGAIGLVGWLIAAIQFRLQRRRERPSA